jgi:crossover junction endodeoxyribonuclease RuvC
MQDKIRILGIDPGFGRLGIAVVEKGQKEILLHSECFETKKDVPHEERLHAIFDRIQNVIKEWQPTTLAIEKLFFNKNVTTGIKVAEVRGAIIALAADHGLSICEYNPLQVKSAVAGYGKATKDQMISMVPKLIKISKPIKHDDEYDAIAIALTCSAIEKVKRN